MRRCVSVCIVLSVLIAFGLLFQGCSGKGSTKQTTPSTAEAQQGVQIRASAAELKIVEETNRVRRNPRAYAAELQAELNGPRSRWETTQTAYEAAIKDLNAAPALKPLTFDEGLFRAAREHAVDMHKMNKMTHTGSDGSTPSERAMRHGNYVGVGENVASSDVSSISDCDCYRTPPDVCDLRRGGGLDGGDVAYAVSLVKHWVLSTTGHRKNVLHEHFTLIGPALVSGHTSPRRFAWDAVQKFAISKN